MAGNGYLPKGGIVVKFYVLTVGGNHRIDLNENGSVDQVSRLRGDPMNYEVPPGTGGQKMFASLAALQWTAPFMRGVPLPQVVGSTAGVKPPTLAEVHETRDAAVAAGEPYGEADILEVVMNYFLECVS